MKIATSSLLVALAGVAAVSIGACVGSDPDFGGSSDDAGGDTSVAESDSSAGSDALVATDTGADAADATSPAAPKTWTCTTAIAPFAPSTNKATNCSDTSVHVGIAYTASQDALGNVSVTASVTVGAGTPVTGMMTSAAGTAGAMNAVDSIVDDVCQSGQAPQAGTFTFSLDKPTNTLTIVYTDADLNAGNASYTAACTVM